MRNLLCIALMFVLAPTAVGELITFEFSGVITEREGSLPAPFEYVTVGDPFTLSYIFESTTPDQEDDPTIGHYTATLGYDLTAGWANHSDTPDVSNLTCVFLENQRYITTLCTEELLLVAWVDFMDGTILTDALPTTLDFDARTEAFMDFGTADGSARGEITSFIPEPSTALMLVGLLAIVRRRE